MNRKTLLLSALALTLSAAAQNKNEKPNILVIWGDDIGILGTSATTAVA